MKTFDKLCKAMDTITGVITVAIMVFITIIVVASVVTRLAGTPIQWQYEATLVCMSWTTFLGMAITFKLDEHMRLTFISNAMPPHFRNIWLAIMDALVLNGLYFLSPKCPQHSAYSTTECTIAPSGAIVPAQA